MLSRSKPGLATASKRSVQIHPGCQTGSLPDPFSCSSLVSVINFPLQLANTPTASKLNRSGLRAPVHQRGLHNGGYFSPLQIQRHQNSLQVTSSIALR